MIIFYLRKYWDKETFSKISWFQVFLFCFWGAHKVIAVRVCLCVIWQQQKSLFTCLIVVENRHRIKCLIMHCTGNKKNLIQNINNKRWIWVHWRLKTFVTHMAVQYGVWAWAKHQPSSQQVAKTELFGFFNTTKKCWNIWNRSLHVVRAYIPSRFILLKTFCFVVAMMAPFAVLTRYIS